MSSSSRLRGPLLRAAGWALVPIAAALVYGNALAGGFVWDDRFLIVDNPRVQSLDRLGELVSHDYVFVAETALAYGYFRPLASLSLALDYRLWGPDPFGFHLTNLLLHAAASLLVCLLARALGAGRAAAFAAGLLFAVHPIHTESVAWIAGRTDLLAFLFAGASLGLHLWNAARPRSNDRLRRALARGCALTLFALALLAKEMAAVVPLWIGCIAFWRSAAADRRRRFGAALRAAAPFLAVVVLYALVRFLLLGIDPPEAPSDHTVARAALSAPITIVRYLGWMAFPGELSAYVQNPYVRTVADPRFLGGVAVLALAAGLVVLLSRRQPRHLGHPPIDLLAAMLLISFAPILNFVRVAGPPDMGALMAERFAYLPSFVFVLLAVVVGEAALARLPHAAARRRLGICLVGGLAVLAPLFAWRTVERNRDWHDEVTFFTQESARTPGAPLLWTNLAQAEMRAGRPEAADRAIRRAESLAPQAPWVLAVRAQWLTLAGRYGEALPLQQAVVRLERKGNALALNNLAFLKRSTGHSREAQEILSDLVERLPSYPDPWLNIAEIERAEGDQEAAIAAYLRYLDLRPRDLRAVEALSGLFAAAGRLEDAEELYAARLRDDAIDARIWNNIGSLRLARGDREAALAAVDRALAIDPASPRARFNRAKLLEITGRAGEGRVILEALAREAPASEVGAAAARELAASPGGSHPSGDTKGKLSENRRR